MGNPVLELRKLSDVPLPAIIPAELGEPARQRALHFANPAARDGFVAGRIALQQFAASLLDVDSIRLTPDYRCPQCGPGQDHGRPGFMLDGGPAPLALSASRASGWVLLAGVVHPPQGFLLGVDLEVVGATDFAGFNDVALTEQEKEFLGAIPGAQQSRQRASLWARKEAWLKMTGEGLRRNPTDVDVLERDGLSDLDLSAHDEMDLVGAIATGWTGALQAADPRTTTG
ncbi:4'-phosphopantetheinyl transferase family protein [Paenarthrobacter sp. JL.01a]|uniref:4'-phosphopantetheinyl transferase family protein n=1 Tax=Paenarthrobacter sp. JL.01a TaxID=2979324 RepID=UPI0021C9BD37|nr:4'-phosphopantetheinyl transferase superfamily protein [Paenarthrobacter sp. JL.01a]UXM93260.1 4'-phosphopantetheinyl transferase superfamily protein [Paenarthrobacter sp. JL.01a]